MISHRVAVTFRSSTHQRRRKRKARRRNEPDVTTSDVLEAMVFRPQERRYLRSHGLPGPGVALTPPSLKENPLTNVDGTYSGVVGSVDALPCCESLFSCAAPVPELERDQRQTKARHKRPEHEDPADAGTGEHDRARRLVPGPR